MNLRTLSALLLTALAAHGAGVKISDLGLSTSPSDNTYLEIADLNASGTNKSAKILYTNLATVATVNAARLWTNSAGTVRLTTQNANDTLKLGADNGAGSGTIEAWTAGTKRWTLNGAALFPESNYDLGTSLKPVQTAYITGGTGVLLGDRSISASTGTPEGNRIAEVGALFLRTDGGAGTTLYTKTSGSGNTGWEALGSGSLMSGTVSNAVASAGLLAVDATKTNGIAATAAHVVSALGYTPANSNTVASSFVLKAGDTMTGPLAVTAFTNTARTASTFVVAAADKSDASTATSSVLASTLSDETGTGLAVFNTNAVLVTPTLGAAKATSITRNSGIEGLYWNGSGLAFLGISSSNPSIIATVDAGVQLGASSATPVAGSMVAASGSGTDKDGASLTIGGGQGTGTGRGGSLIFRTSNTSTTGSTAQTYTERSHVIGKYVTLTESSATTILTIPVPATNYVGLAATITIYATDGTDHQSKTSRILVDAIAKTTTITPTLTQVDNTTAASAGTLSCTYTVADNGSNVLALKANAVSSLTQTVLRAHIVVTAINSNGTAAITEQ